MKVTVFHRDHETNAFIRVAVVNAPMNDEMQALEYAYRWTQNIMDSWSHPEGVEDKNENVEIVGELPVYDGKTYGLRSSMMHDRFYTENGAYECAMCGFEELPVVEEVA